MSLKINVKEPAPNFHSSFFHDALLKSKPYSLEPSPCKTKLDQNENPFDWEEDFKKEVMGKLLEESWNTYPEDYPRELKKLLADYVNVSPQNIVLSPGSNYHITVLLNLFAAKKTRDIIITRPSFALFEGHCVYQNIPYKTWDLSSNLEYDLSLLPKIKTGSCLFFASPNNPVGNTLSRNLLVELLEKYPESYFICDEAYWEFTEKNCSELLENYSNLIILRTFSKAMGAAGIRLSYVLSSESFCKELSKVTLPFLVNKFTSVAATCALKSESFMARVWKNIALLKEERENLYKEISNLKPKKFKVLNSEANFISFLCDSHENLEKIQHLLLKGGIVIRNVSNPSLKNTLRITVGKQEDSKKVISLLKNFC